MMGIELWTIGHSTHSADDFVSLLQAQRIELLADVRQFPGSRRYPHFNREALKASLAKAGIGYKHFADLGGRRVPKPNSPNTAWRNDAFRGYADYMTSPEFDLAINRLATTAAEKRTAVMCAEALWWQCHRGLIADYFKVRGITVWHILPGGKIEEHPYTSAAQIVNGRLTYAALPLT
ncbi:MAG: DUF488 domain-containing protein [Verrucomicrobia subdivision 3 bacterium]|nr:DUF488 domain-containing protein [Limisphaerales bacterium]